MRLIYIGDHIDDMDGSFGAGATTITVDNTAGFVAGRNYWIVGPISGGGCTPTYHSEKVTVTEIGTPNADDLTVVRDVDGTGLANNCQWVSGADFIEDDKTHVHPRGDRKTTRTRATSRSPCCRREWAVAVAAARGAPGLAAAFSRRSTWFRPTPRLTCQAILGLRS